MASSGWQGAATIHNAGGGYPRLDMDLYIASISHSGDTLSFTATLKVYVVGGGSMYDQTGNSYLSLTGGGTHYISYGSTTSVQSDFSCSVSSSSSSTSYTVTGSFSGSNMSGSASWTLSFDPSGTPPTGLTATLVEAGPDWADIAVSISSWGSPSTSASRYIEASVLGSSTYGNPYKFKTATAVTSATLHVDNTCGGNLTIVPNTQYHVGGFATNQTRLARIVGAAFTTLPAVPIINALDQGHGVIDVTVAHANEGSALSITEEYSIDGGTTWNTITGGAFSLTLSAQTVLTVRRSSTAGVSSGTVTVAPHFDVAIYASVMNKSKLITKVYAPKALGAKRLVDLSCTSQPGDITLTLMDSDDFVEQFNSNQTLSDIVYYGDTLQGITVTFFFNSGTQEASYDFMFSFGQTREIVNDVDPAAWGFSAYGETTDGDTGSVTVSGSYEDILQSKKIAKIYASVNGKTKLVFEDPS